jgi:hypothetical protein
MDDDNFLKLLQEDQRLTSMNDPEAQVAEAIAAFAMNNLNRKRNAALLSPLLIPCLNMVETTPAFHNIAVTAALSAVVQADTYPEIETRVLRYITALPCRNRGNAPLPNRHEIVRCLQTFKKHIGEMKQVRSHTKLL